MKVTLDLKTIGFWVMAGLMLLFLIRSFNACNGMGRPTSDTISVRRDTVWVHEGRDTVYQPQIITVTDTRTNTVYRPVTHTDTLWATEVLPTDTAAIIARFYQKAFYSDTQRVKYGKVIINDSVHQNRITYRNFVADLNVPEVTNTITVAQKRNVVYLDFAGMGTISSPLYALGGGLTLKNKQDKLYSVGAMTTINGDVYYTGKFSIPIRLRKPK